MQKPFTFFFDYLSPFSYLAWHRLGSSPWNTIPVEARPVPLGPLLNHWGIKGPGEVTPKRIFLLKQLLRYTDREKLPFTTPLTHPFNSLYALRLSLKEVAGEEQSQVIAALWKAGWQERIDMGDPEALTSALRKAGLRADELYEKSFMPEAKKALKENISLAIEQGVFGVPSFIAGNELFWGHDSMSDLLAYLQGQDNLNHSKLAFLLSQTERAASQSI